MTYTEEIKHTIVELKKKGVGWAAIGLAVGKSANAVKKWYSKNRPNLDLPQKIKVSKKMTDGRIGLKIKQIVNETPNASLSEIRSALGSSIIPGTPCPS